MSNPHLTLKRALSPLVVTVITIMFFWIGDKTLYPLCVRFKQLADRAIACPLVMPEPVAIVAFLIALSGMTASAFRLYRFYSQPKID